MCGTCQELVQALATGENAGILIIRWWLLLLLLLPLPLPVIGSNLNCNFQRFVVVVAVVLAVSLAAATLMFGHKTIGQTVGRKMRIIICLPASCSLPASCRLPACPLATCNIGCNIPYPATPSIQFTAGSVGVYLFDIHSPPAASAPCSHVLLSRTHLLVHKSKIAAATATPA